MGGFEHTLTPLCDLPNYHGEIICALCCVTALEAGSIGEQALTTALTHATGVPCKEGWRKGKEEGLNKKAMVVFIR